MEKDKEEKTALKRPSTTDMRRWAGAHCACAGDSHDLYICIADDLLYIFTRLSDHKKVIPTFALLSVQPSN